MDILKTVDNYDTTIRNIAQNGEYDYIGEMSYEINWKQNGQYIMVYDNEYNK